LDKIALNGTVSHGGGEGKKFLELPWVKRQIHEKLGFTPYPGTLNVKLSQESAEHKKLLEKAHSFEVCPAEGYCRGMLIRASIGTLECAVVVPEVAGYPANLLEIIAALNLRETLQLEDGDEVTVTVNF
jgi:riboflavin kinase